MNIAKKLAYATASAAFALGTFASITLAADLEITDNGKDSVNTIIVTSSSDCTVSQKANTNVEALVGASASTGGNTASGNTGGTTSITTGNATATATMTVTGGTNTAVDPCCCSTGSDPQSAEISGNGNGSANTVTQSNTKTATIRQRARTNVGAMVGARARTGKNRANNNTGTGTTIDTGKSDASADLTVTGGTNTLP